MLLPNSLEKNFFSQVKNIAIIGAKDKENTAVDRVGRYLINQGYTIFPVHPVRKNIWGLTTYSNVTEISEPIDLVDVFRAPEFCFTHAQEILQLTHTPDIFWMQLGISDIESRKLLEQHKVKVIENKCIMIEMEALAKEFT